jgi:hypothetical protein
MLELAKMSIVSLLLQLAKVQPDRSSEPAPDCENCRVSPPWPPVTVAVDDTRPDPTWVRPLKIAVVAPVPPKVSAATLCSPCVASWVMLEKSKVPLASCRVFVPPPPS